MTKCCGGELSMEGIVVKTSSGIPNFLKSRRSSAFLNQPLNGRSLCWGLSLVVQSSFAHKVFHLVSFGKEELLDYVFVSDIFIIDLGEILGLDINIHQHVGSLCVPHLFTDFDVRELASPKRLYLPDVSSIDVDLISNSLDGGH